MAKEAPENSFHTVCGAFQCRCTRIMSHLVDSKTPFFFASNNFTMQSGPDLPAKFVQEHGHEINVVVNLEAAGEVFAVELVFGETGDDDSVSMGLGWESFMGTAKFHAEDLLFFALEGQSNFAVIPVRGHNRRKAEAEPEKPKRKLKPSERLLSEVLEGGTSSRAKGAAKRQKPGQTSKPPAGSYPPQPPTLGSGEGTASQEPIAVQDLKTDSKSANDPGKQHVTQETIHDALESCMPLLDFSHSGSDDTEMEESSGEFEEDRSDFEDEREFKNHSRSYKHKSAR